jgi:hypothetical protein
MAFSFLVLSSYLYFSEVGERSVLVRAFKGVLTETLEASRALEIALLPISLVVEPTSSTVIIGSVTPSPLG